VAQRRLKTRVNAGSILVSGSKPEGAAPFASFPLQRVRAFALTGARIGWKLFEEIGVPLRKQFEVFERALNFKRALLRIQSKETIQ